MEYMILLVVANAGHGVLQDAIHHYAYHGCTDVGTAHCSLQLLHGYHSCEHDTLYS